MNGQTFKAACCERYGISPAAFAERVLWRCHHRRSLPLGKLVWRFNAAHYDVDLELLNQVAECTSLADVRAEVSNFRYHHPNHGFCRKRLHVRLSGQRLVNLAAKMLA